MSQIHIFLPNEPKEEIEKVKTTLRDVLNIKNMILLPGDNNSLIILRRTKTGVSEVMAELTKIGVGVKYGIIDILPLNVSIPEIASEDNSKQKEDEELKKRVSLEEIQKNIKEISNPDFNFKLFIILAALVAGAGLLLNSSAILIASMIISPLMGPILGLSYGIIAKDRSILRSGIRGQVIGLIFGYDIGLVLGLCALIINPDFAPTSEMLARNFPGFFEILIAVCAGIAVGFCVTSSVQSALVGIAIAVALLPPLVNSGINLILGEFLLSSGSFILALVNILLINLCAYSVFKLKQIRSILLTSIFWRGTEEPSKKQEEPPEKPTGWFSRFRKSKKQSKN